MTAEGEFPKSDGDILYASETNRFFNHPKMLYSGASADFTFTPTIESSGLVVAYTTGQTGADNIAATTVTFTTVFSLSGVETQRVVASQYSSINSSPNIYVPFALQGVAADLGSNVAITGSIHSTGTLSNLKTVIMEYTQYV